jgi:hypothetical protein
MSYFKFKRIEHYILSGTQCRILNILDDISRINVLLY